MHCKNTFIAGAMKIKHSILLIVATIFSFSSHSQIKYSDLTNEDGEVYKYSKGPAYYNDTLFTGGAVEYYPDTVLWRKTSFANGEPNGYEIFYFETGTPWCIGLRDNRAKQGEWLFYRRNGEIQGREVFKDGFLISEPITITEEP